MKEPATDPKHLMNCACIIFLFSSLTITVRYQQHTPLGGFKTVIRMFVRMNERPTYDIATMPPQRNQNVGGAAAYGQQTHVLKFQCQ